MCPWLCLESTSLLTLCPTLFFPEQGHLGASGGTRSTREAPSWCQCWQSLLISTWTPQCSISRAKNSEHSPPVGLFLLMRAGRRVLTKHCLRIIFGFVPTSNQGWQDHSVHLSISLLISTIPAWPEPANGEKRSKAIRQPYGITNTKRAIPCN